MDVGRDPRGRRGAVALTYRKDLRESLYSPQAMQLGLGLGLFYRAAPLLLGGQTVSAGRRAQRRLRKQGEPRRAAGEV